MTVQDPALNFEDLLQTVKESERGRWFISEFESRLRKSDTSNILSAIAKLEGVIASQSQGGVDAALVSRARTAIAAARREIANLDKDKQQFSDEGRLFAKLADMARAAFQAEDAGASLVNAGVSRALLLVDQLDQDFASAPMAEGKVAYIPQDQDVFEQPRIAVSPKTIEAPASIKPLVKEVERGAKLAIRKSGEPLLQAPAAEPVATASPEPAPAAEVPAPVADVPRATEATAAAPQAKQSRVVIIRRKPEELLDVPLVDENSASTAA